MPAQQMRGGINGVRRRATRCRKLDGHLWVPIDDEQTNVYNWQYSADPAIGDHARAVRAHEHHSGRGQEDLIPGTFKLKRNPSNDYLIDRQMQKTQTFTGIDGVNTQDSRSRKAWGRSSTARTNFSAPPTARS